MVRYTFVRLVPWPWRGPSSSERSDTGRGFDRVHGSCLKLKRNSSLTQGGLMVSTLQVSSILCGLALLLSVAAAIAQAPNDPTRFRTIKGEVTHVGYAYYFVKEADGTELRMHTDNTTQMMGQLKLGDRIEAEVTDQNHARRMRQLP